MARYRKVEVRIWNDEKFRRLSDDGKLLFFALLTHPNLTRVGAMKATRAGLAEELGWTTERLTESLAESLAEGLVEHDPRTHFLCLPNFLKHNRPESPNVVRSWVNDDDMLPECELKSLHYQRVKAFSEGLPKAFTEGLPEVFAKASRTRARPEQEQEQEPEQETAQPCAPAPAREAPPPSDAPPAGGTATAPSASSASPTETASRAVREWEAVVGPRALSEQHRIAKAVEVYGEDVVLAAMRAAAPKEPRSFGLVRTMLDEECSGNGKPPRKAPRGPPVVRVPEGHPCHGHRVGEPWDDDAGRRNVVGEDGWWYVRTQDGQERRVEPVTS